MPLGQYFTREKPKDLKSVPYFDLPIQSEPATMPRFYCPIPLQTSTSITLPEHIARHIQVLRLQTGDTVTLFNGEGGEYSAKLDNISKKSAEATIYTHNPRECEPAHPVTLAQALPEGTKMDWILEKATELGATHIQTLQARRCVVKLNSERAEKKQAHWQGILASASEQCGRNRIPQLLPTLAFEKWITQPAEGPRILLSPRATESLAQWHQKRTPGPVTILIGPEGGFAPEEEQLAEKNGVLLLSMGDRILRTETAGLAALAVLNLA